MDERRQLPRWEVRKEAKVWLQQTQAFSHCMIEDLHLKGMRVAFNKRLLQQEFIEMSLAIGEGFDLIKIEARVHWSQEEQDKYIYGLSFNRIAEDDKERIYQYISANCYDQFKNKWWA